MAEFFAPDELVCVGEEDGFVHPVTLISPPFGDEVPPFKQTNPILQRFGTPGNSKQKKFSKQAISSRLLYLSPDSLNRLVEFRKATNFQFQTRPTHAWQATILLLLCSLRLLHVLSISEDARTCSGRYHFCPSRPSKEPLTATSSSSHLCLFIGDNKWRPFAGSPGPVDAPASEYRGGGLFISEYLMALGNDPLPSSSLLPPVSPAYPVQDTSASEWLSSIPSQQS